MPLYRGRVLLSLKTEMDDLEASPGIRVETLSAFPIIEVIQFIAIPYFRDCFIQFPLHSEKQIYRLSNCNAIIILIIVCKKINVRL